MKRGGWSISSEGAGVQGCAEDAGTIARRRHKAFRKREACDKDMSGDSMLTECGVGGRLGSSLVSGGGEVRGSKHAI